ncbi:hypothetical protein [Glycomyces salinus]|uniref:hypothetical protein n=1 Tax=Glycomyces salinus TaxID=980294 RepID=UPI0018EDD5C7|nr:hypothetical protein [Glycomyces salinus]
MKMRLAASAIAFAAAALVGAAAPAAAQAADISSPAAVSEAGPLPEVHYLGAYPTKPKCQDVTRQLEIDFDVYAWCEAGNNDGRLVWKAYYYFR